MKLYPGFVSLMSLLCCMILSPEARAQMIPGSLGFSINGSFTNAAAISNNSILITDNDLTNGYDAGFDLTDAPAILNPTGGAGSAAFQWGDPGTSTGFNYAHASAMWFQPLAVSNAVAETSFDLGFLYYRNGTIKSNTGASWIDLAMTLSFSQPLGLDPISIVFGSELINTPNNSNDEIASADVVSLNEFAAPVNFKDASGNQYYLELTFKVDQNTIDNTLSTQNQFRVFEGHQGSATLVGRFTVDPIGPQGTNQVPEPSSAIIAALGMLLTFRRRR
jgi:hypothetical protein